MPCLELENAAISIINPDEAVPYGTTRKISRTIGAAEYLQLLAGVSCLSQLDDASGGRFSSFADNGRLGGAYGPRVWRQLPAVASKLEADPDTRQAVVTIWSGADRELAVPSHDVPCTLALQFRVRHQTLRMTVLMRSSDVWLGVPYDWWQFTRLQMTMAWALGLSPGTFTFFAGSMHLYEQDASAASALEMREPAQPQPPAITGEGFDFASAPSCASDKIMFCQDLARSLVMHDENAFDHGGTGWYRQVIPRLRAGQVMCQKCRYVSTLVRGKTCAACDLTSARSSSEP